MTTLRFGALDSRHRARLAEILDATAVFSPEETPYAATRRFDARCGYHESARVAAFYGPADDRVIYAKRLRPRGEAAPQAALPSTTN